MKELLQKLLEADVLSDDTKKELQEAFESKLNEAIAAAKEEEAVKVRAEITEQWISEREALVEAIDSKMTDTLTAEIEELKEDIERFRDLEAEYAERIVEEKAAIAEQLKSDLGDLVKKIDSFLEIRLVAEMDELREDIAEISKVQFGRKVFEAFMNEFMDGYVDEDSTSAALHEAEDRVATLTRKLNESETQRKKIEREVKMEKILAPLAGHQRDVMEAILRTVETEALEEGYKTFIGRVIRESSSEKEGKVLAEGADEDGKDVEGEDEDDTDDKGKKDKDGKEKDTNGKKDDKKEDKKVTEGRIVTGDVNRTIIEESNTPKSTHLDYLRMLAGISTK